MKAKPLKFYTAIGLHKKQVVLNYSGQPITETLTNGFFTVDSKWNVTYWNREAEKLLGVSSADIIGKNLWEQFAGLLPVEFYDVYYKAFLQDIPVHFEEYWGEMGAWFDVITYYCDDTLSVSFKSCNHPHPEYPDNPVKRLKILTELYRYVTEITNDCLWEWNLLSGELFWIDGGHKRVLGYNIENALIPQSFWESCLHPEEKKQVLRKLKLATTGKADNLWEDKFRFRKADGNYVWVADRGHIIRNEENIAVRMIGATQDITKLVEMENKVALERSSRQKEITSAILGAQEQERQHIGEELHDNLNQVLAVVKMNIQQTINGADQTGRYLDKALDLVQKVMTEIRNISKKLIIPPLTIIGLEDNISNLLLDIKALHSTKFDFNVKDIDMIKMDSKLQTTLFRIVQEQVNNIIHHAKATHAGIYLTGLDKGIEILFTDNGKGCNTAATGKGVGIRNITSRVELYNGQITIVSKPGQGYKLRIFIPTGKESPYSKRSAGYGKK